MSLKKGIVKYGTFFRFKTINTHFRPNQHTTFLDLKYIFELSICAKLKLILIYTNFNLTMKFNKTYLLLATLPTLASCANSAKKETLQNATPPNIIYILADDLGYGDLSCYGQQRFTTPNIDKLASEGVKFTNHYAGSSVSAPSRCSLMTGLHTGHGTFRENRSLVTGKRIDLTDEDITIAQVLKDKGYATGAFGKWGLGTEGSEATPNKKGFDSFVGFIDQEDAHNHYPAFLYRNEDKFTIPENQNGNCGVYANDIFTEETKKFITDNKDKPFFVYLPYTIPHAELLVPDEDLNPQIGKFDPETPYAPDPIKTYRHQMTPHAAFVGMMTRMDNQIGEIMALLKELGLDENTIVMFSSDNGPHDVGGADPAYFNGGGGFKGIKRDLYEGGIRVPFIARWKGVIEEGKVSDHVSAFWDIMPTLCEISGTELPRTTDGISLLPTLVGGDKKQMEHENLYWEYISKKRVLQAVRMGDYKAVKHGLDRPIEIFNIIEDAGETKDLAAKHPELVKKAEELFVKMRVPSKEFPAPDLDKKAI